MVSNSHITQSIDCFCLSHSDFVWLENNKTAPICAVCVPVFQKGTAAKIVKTLSHQKRQKKKMKKTLIKNRADQSSSAA